MNTTTNEELPITELPDGSGCFTATILSHEEAMALPISKRPLAFRLSSEMYHDTFYAIGGASMCWNPTPNKEIFDASRAEKIAVDLCFKIANETEKWMSLSVTEVCAGNKNVHKYILQLEEKLAKLEKIQ